MIKKNIKRILIMIMSVMLIFTSCVKVADMSTPSSKNKILVSIFPINDAQTIEAIEIFKEKVSELSQNTIEIEYAISQYPIDDVKKGKSQMAILPTKQLVPYNKNFEMLTSPFFFKDIVQSSMTINSKDFKELFNPYCIKSTGCTLLGSAFLESKKLITNGERLYSAESFWAKAFYIDSESEILSEIATQFNSYVTNLNSGEIFNATENIENIIVECPVNKLDKLNLTSPNKTIYSIKQPVEIESQWVMIDNKFWGSLLPKNADIIKKATSYFLAYCEQPRIILENEMLLKNDGITLTETDSEEAISSLRGYIKLSGEFNNRWDLDVYDAISLIIK